MRTWGFLTNHALVLLCIARDPGVRLRDIAASVGITERSAFGIVSDLAVAGYIVKEKGGRRNRYRVETQRPLPESADRNLAIGDLLALLGARMPDSLAPGQNPAEACWTVSAVRAPTPWPCPSPDRPVHCRRRQGDQALGHRTQAGWSACMARPARRRTRPPVAVPGAGSAAAWTAKEVVLDLVVQAAEGEVGEPPAADVAHRQDLPP